MTVPAVFSFLTSGPRLGFQIDEDLAQTPELSSPLTVNNGYGWRSYDFVPAHRHSWTKKGHRLLRTFADRDGRPVQLYQREAPPAQWYLRWHLARGVLVTHLREEEGPDRSEIYVRSLGIAEYDGLPFLLPDPPMGLGASAHPGYQEFAIYASATTAEHGIVLQRPGFMQRGRVMKKENEGRAVLRGGGPHGVDIIVLGGRDHRLARERMSMAMDTLDTA